MIKLNFPAPETAKMVKTFNSKQKAVVFLYMQDYPCLFYLLGEFNNYSLWIQDCLIKSQ